MQRGPVPAGRRSASVPQQSPYADAIVIDRPEGLPDYERPPVVEVALAVQFDPEPQLRQGHLGLYWSEIIGDYPKVRDQQPLEPVNELFDDRSAPTFQLEILDEPPLYRAWFGSQDDTRLVQVQSDRFVHNWRQQAGDQYPRFSKLHGDFATSLGQFEEVLAGAGVPALTYNHVEVTYINWIEADRLGEFLVISEPPDLGGYGVGPKPEEQTYGARYVVQAEGKPIGRLYVRAGSARRPGEGDEPEHGFLLTLDFRAPIPMGSDPADMAELMSAGRNTIVDSFTRLTRPDMQTNKWERIT